MCSRLRRTYGCCRRYHRNVQPSATRVWTLSAVPPRSAAICDAHRDTVGGAAAMCSHLRRTYGHRRRRCRSVQLSTVAVIGRGQRIRGTPAASSFWYRRSGWMTSSKLKCTIVVTPHRFKYSSRSYCLLTWVFTSVHVAPYFAMPSYSATMIVPSLRIQMKSTRSGKSGLFGLGNVLCIADAAA